MCVMCTHSMTMQLASIFGQSHEMKHVMVDRQTHEDEQSECSIALGDACVSVYTQYDQLAFIIIGQS